ncbi:MAG: bi-domain-containing oxidoreductase [Bdellovibrionales bacterium]|nr:bi-domain-containing oxidoreductase [Bdellovibrionales bacterium]
MPSFLDLAGFWRPYNSTIPKAPMRQLFQNLKTGEVSLENLPAPHCGAGQVLIQNTASLISLGTEKMLLDFGKANWIDKARQQPEKVQMVLNKVKTDGLMPTLNAVKNKLDQPIALGYCSVGVVREVGSQVHDLQVGDRVVSNGPHAEFVCVGRNLVCPIPVGVKDEEAAFTVVASIGLQSVRLIKPEFGETIVVVGLGLIGLLTVQTLLAHGCRVIGYDFDEKKVELAKKFGAQAFRLMDGVDPVKECLQFNQDQEVDGVIITASNSSDEIVSQAAQMSRKRGRIVLLGVIGLDLKRSDFYEKELSFQVSCSYGPGRYDPLYEEKGLDYPIGFVRWTENRNFSAILEAMKNGRLKTDELLTTRTSVDQAPKVHRDLLDRPQELGVLIEYPQESSIERTIQYAASATSNSSLGLAWLGAGQFASAVLLPAFKSQGFDFVTLGCRSGGIASTLAKKYGFATLSSDYNSILADKNIPSVVISTRHSSHGSLVLQALKQGKNVFVEKPLAIKESEVEEISEFFKNQGPSAPILMVGFNRRFAPLTLQLKGYLKAQSSAKAFIMTVNAGEIPGKHWTQDPSVGGGRLVGEGCHFIDLIRSLSGSAIQSTSVTPLRSLHKDTYTIQMQFENGDIGTIHYFANGSKDFPKERLEVFVAGRIFQLDNFRSLSGRGFQGLKSVLKTQDKGHMAEVQAFKEAIQKGDQPIPLEEIFEVSFWSARLQNQLFSSALNET